MLSSARLLHSSKVGRPHWNNNVKHTNIIIDDKTKKNIASVPLPVYVLCSWHILLDVLCIVYHALLFVVMRHVSFFCFCLCPHQS